MSTTPTAAAARAAFESQGITGEALAFAVKAGAPERHEARVQATLAAARACASANNIPDAETRGAALLLAADLMGIGGPRGIGGDGTTRLLPGLGASRWQANDGAAYQGAARDALWRITRAPDGAPRLHEPLVISPDDALELPEPWGGTMARRGLLRALGVVVGAVEDRGGETIPVRFADASPRLWGAVLNVCAATAMPDDASQAALTRAHAEHAAAFAAEDTWQAARAAAAEAQDRSAE